MFDASISRRGGVLLGIAGIILIAATLRLPVGALSPLAEVIDTDIPLSAATLGVLGMLPPIGFAVAGVTAPWVAHRVGLERTLLLALITMIAGHLARAAAPDLGALALGSLLLLLGAGFGNVLLPAAVKRITPGAIGPMTAAYATIMAIGSAVPPLLAVPLAESGSWRVSLASWSLVVALALVPWIALVVRERREARFRGPLDDGITEPDTHRFAQLARSKTVWGITIPFTVSSISAYVTFALMPVILQDLAAVSAAEAGSLLALFAILGMPLALIAPVLTARLRTPSVIIVASMLLFGVGYGGLLIAPAEAPAVWITAIGLGQVTFPMCLALFSLRTASAKNAANLSGFVQTVGYAIAALSPLALGSLHELTGSWSPSLAIMLVIVVSPVLALPLLARGARVEDDLRQSPRP